MNLWGAGVLFLSGALVGWAAATWTWSRRISELARLINGGGKHRDSH